MEDIYEVARVKRARSTATTFQGTVMEVLGTCVSLNPYHNCTIEGESPKEIQKKIREGLIIVPEQ
jgi:large subunit ribosomal protein L12e